jgi:hypothetical protein
MNCHPFVWIREPSRKIMLWAFTGLAVLTMLALERLGGPLRTEASPGGIVSFELAGNTANTERILESWDPNARIYAGLNLGVDFLFIDAYVGAIGLGCVLAGTLLERRSHPLGVAGRYLAWAIVLAGMLDCVENYALIRLLLGSRQTWLAVVARWCALPKFLIVFAGLLYIALGLILSLSMLGRGDD